jgi:osmotically-inducible protein OsmY
LQNGVATIKGQVRTQEEKAAIEAKAAAVVGQDHVVDQMEISPQGH